MDRNTKTTGSQAMHAGSAMSALGFAIVFPSIVTFVYFVALRNQAASVQQSAYVIGKAIQFGFPILWVWLFLKIPNKTEYLRELNPFSNRTNELRANMFWGVLFGLLAAVAMLLLYWFWLKNLPSFAGAKANIEQKIQGLNLNSVWAFVAVGAFYALCHSFMEEYYWRWFVFSRLKAHLTSRLSVAISSLGFMAHHVILLAVYFGWDSPLTYFFSISVAVGGVVWAILYERSKSLAAPWVSHMIIDAAIFVVGYLIAF